MRIHWMGVCLIALGWSAPAFGQCVVGPDAESGRALQTAFEAQSAISDHLTFAAVDRDSRELSDLARDNAPKRGSVTAQASLNFETTAVPGFWVCDAAVWENAKLQNQALGATASIGSRGVARVEMRLFGVSDSIIQRDLNPYYPEREIGAEATVPGATGAGHGLWSARVEVLDAVSLTVGRVTSHTIVHSVGWDEETDEDGNTSIEKSHTAHWGLGGPARTFVALGVPRLGAGDLVMGQDNVERVHAGSGWIVPRPRRPIGAFRIDGGWDGLVRAPVLGGEFMPLGGIFDTRGLPTFRVRTAAEGTTAILREASVTARWGYAYERAGLAVPGDLAAFEVESGLYGSRRVAETDEQAFAPGAVARVDAAVPFYAVIKMSLWAGINREETIRAVPEALNRPEWGISFYATYAL